MEYKQEYKYNCGLVVGRFQLFHTGHKSIIEQALKECKQVICLVGSAQLEARNERNPFTYEERVCMIRSCFDWYDNVRLPCIPLVDIGAGDSPVWGNYLMNTCLLNYGYLPDVYYTGKEPDRNSWLSNYPQVKSVVVDRALIPINATQIRQKIAENKLEEVKEYIPKGVLNFRHDFAVRTIKKVMNKESNND